MSIAIYPGTFDPVTNGHLDIALRASRLFDKVVMGVYDTPSKDLMFTTEERVNLIKSSIDGVDNIEIMPFSGLTVKFAEKVQAKAIVRGLRIGADFEYEREMALMNNKLSPGVEIVCLMASLKYQYVSSSRLKEVARLEGDIYDLVPEPVIRELKKRCKN